VVAALNVLAISGSLRARSSNTEVVRASVIVAPPFVRIRMFEGLADLPYFNPDLDGEGAVAPVRVAQFRADIAAADAVLISSPEYAHGVPGVLKNALDWLVSDPAIVFKPIAVLNISRRSTYAHASLLETLRTMSTLPLPFELPLTSTTQSAEDIAADPEIAKALRLSLDDLWSAARRYRQRMASF
jgi:chromate reductase